MDPLQASLTRRESPQHPFRFCACREAASWKSTNQRDHRMRWSFFARPVMMFSGHACWFLKRSFKMVSLRLRGCASCGSIECNIEPVVWPCSCHAIGVGEVEKEVLSTSILPGTFKSSLCPGSGGASWSKPTPDHSWEINAKGIRRRDAKSAHAAPPELG